MEGMQGGFRVIAENVQDGTYTVQVFDASGAEICTVRWSQSQTRHEGRLPSRVTAMGTFLSALADLPSRMADVGIQTAALFT